MKRTLQIIAVVISLAVAINTVHAAPEEQDTFGQKTKRFFGGLNPFSNKQKQKKPKKGKTPSPTPTPTPTASADLAATSATPTQTPTTTPAPTPTPVENATMSAQEIVDYDKNVPQIRGIIDNALGLTSLNLDYRYGSADPANGGMDCSGFVYYVLTKCGVRDVPRDARDQYAWVRKAGNFQAVMAQSEDSFELNSLQPGDLLFWGNTSSTNAEPAIAETMIYMGKEKSTGKRLMVGATDGRMYKGLPRHGVSIVDFKVAPSQPKSEDEVVPKFVGYGRVPGLAEP